MDRSLYILVLLLFLVGETTILSVNTVPYLWETPTSLSIYKRPLLQLVSLIVGLFLAVHLIPRIGYHRMKSKAVAYGFILLSTFLLLTVLIKKIITGKAVDRWLIGSSLQPMEFTKLAVIIFLSYYIVSKGSLREYKYIFWSAFLVVVNALLLFFQPDRGSAIFILFLAGGLLFVGGLPFKILIPIVGVFFLLGVYILFGQKSYVHDRLSAWMDPFKDAEDTGYQIVQSLYALADGGLWGKGMGKGIQKMGYLPQADTDFVIATIGEELGFVGVGVLSLLYFLLVFRIFYWSLRHQDLFGKLVLFGIGTNFAFAFLWNVGMATNLLPPKGIALPFVSYGVSNLLMSVVMIGVSQEVIRYAKNPLPGSGWYSEGMARGQVQGYSAR